MNYNLTQLNIAKMIAPIDDPIMMDFVNNLERINVITIKNDFTIEDMIDYNVMSI